MRISGSCLVLFDFVGFTSTTQVEVQTEGTVCLLTYFMP